MAFCRFTAGWVCDRRVRAMGDIQKIKKCQVVAFLILCLGLMTACSGNSGNSLNNLPSCGSSNSLLSVSPMAANEYIALSPLGNLNPTGHVFPSDHAGIYGNRENGVAVYVPVKAPADMTITMVTSSERIGGVGAAFTDYRLTFSPCSDVQFYFGHMTDLSDTILAAIGTFSDDDCSDYTTGGTTYRTCSKSFTDLNVFAGDVLGHFGGIEGNYGMDFGAYDARIDPLAYANPDRIEAASNHFDQLHSVCVFDYFDDANKAVMETKFGNINGAPRTIAPVCGEVEQDEPGTAQGKWYNDAVPNGPEDPHLALVHDNVDPTIPVFSNGTTFIGISSTVQQFTPLSTGRVNRDFGDVTADGAAYCYESVGGASDTIIILQLTDASTLKIEAQNGASCGAGPWNFTSSAFIFKR